MARKWYLTWMVLNGRGESKSWRRVILVTWIYITGRKWPDSWFLVPPCVWTDQFCTFLRFGEVASAARMGIVTSARIPCSLTFSTANVGNWSLNLWPSCTLLEPVIAINLINNGVDYSSNWTSVSQIYLLLPKQYFVTNLIWLNCPPLLVINWP